MANWPKKLNNMPVIKYGNTSKRWVVVGTRIPPEDYERLDNKFPDRGKKSELVRALIQMYLDGKITCKIEFNVQQEIRPNDLPR